MRVTILTVTLGALVLVAAPAALAATECRADVDATLEHEEDGHLQYSVEVSSSERCAEIEYDLIIEERLPNGHMNRVRKIRQVRLRDGSLTEIVRHTLQPGHTRQGHEAKVESCRPCDD